MTGRVTAVYNDVIELGKPVIVEDDYGNQSKEYVFKEVFAEVKSVSQTEYYTAA
ncbi:MAG: phage head closure protein, partial [Clostridia bacterium]|nr:phage head closure protein [Clostridia bacterium]